MLFPSQFDTFGCAVLESMSCGLPVAAYDTKGPRDIITDGVDGLLFQPDEDWAARVTSYLRDASQRKKMSARAQERAGRYQAEPVLAGLLDFIGLGGDPHRQREVAAELDGDAIPFGAAPSFLADLIGVVGEA